MGSAGPYPPGGPLASEQTLPTRSRWVQHYPHGMESLPDVLPLPSKEIEPPRAVPPPSALGELLLCPGVSRALSAALGGRRVGLQDGLTFTQGTVLIREDTACSLRWGHSTSRLTLPSTHSTPQCHASPGLHRAGAPGTEAGVGQDSRFDHRHRPTW